MAKPKSKLAYLSYDQIQPRIDSGLLDEYDLIFEKNSHEMLILDKDKNIVPVKSTLDSYQSESDAITALNSKTNTYVGQIVNILEGNKYVPFSVNLNSSTGDYYITRVGVNDYDELINKPIINIVADNEVIISELEDGIYSLVGNYRINTLDPTHRMTTSKRFFIKDTSVEDGNIYITEINGKSIEHYVCTDVDFVEDRYVLVSELGNEVEDVLDVELPGRMDEYVNENEATPQQINSLFDTNTP